MVAPKGAELTYGELDNNFIILYDWLKSMGSGANLSPYNAGTTYADTPPTYVSYNGNIWHFVSGTPASGITPGTNPAYWEQVTIGAIAHVQNTDQYLDIGGPYALSVQEIYEKVHNIVIDTRANIAALASGGSLVAGIYYMNTDDNVIQFAIDGENLDPMGTLIADYTALPFGGVWAEKVMYRIQSGTIIERWDAQGNHVRIAEGLSDTCMTNFPFGDNLSFYNEIDSCNIAASPGYLYKCRAGVGADITIDASGGLIDFEIAKGAVYDSTGTASVITGGFIREYGELQNTSSNDHLNVMVPEHGYVSLTGTSTVDKVYFSKTGVVTVLDSTISNLNLGPSLELLIDTQTIAGDSTSCDVIERNNNSISDNATNGATISMSGKTFVGKILVGGSSGNADNIGVVSNMTDYWALEVAPVSGVTVTLRDNSVGAGNLYLDAGTIALNGTKGDKAWLRLNTTSSRWYLERKIQYL